MQAVILAGGHGIRLRPLTDLVPKPLISISGKPILIRTLEQLPPTIREVVLVIGYRGKQIVDFLGPRFNHLTITYIHQEKALGTADALWQCSSVLSYRFIVLMGDDLYLRQDLEKCTLPELSFGVYATKYPPPRFKMSTLIKRDGTLKGVIPRSNNRHKEYHIPTGVYKLNKRIFTYRPQYTRDGELGLPNTVVLMAKDYRVKVVKMNFWVPIATLEDIRRAETLFARIE